MALSERLALTVSRRVLAILVADELKGAANLALLIASCRQALSDITPEALSLARIERARQRVLKLLRELRDEQGGTSTQCVDA